MLFRQLAGNIPQVFWMCDAADKRLVYVSPPCEKLLGINGSRVPPQPSLTDPQFLPNDSQVAAVQVPLPHTFA